jgi:hypothetical protein
LIVPARWAYKDYLNLSLYRCQEKRFKEVEWVAFYTGKEVKPEIARVLHIEPFVQYTTDFVMNLITRGGPNVGIILQAMSDLWSRNKVDSRGNQLIILSGPNDKRTFLLPNPIVHNHPGPWTQNHRWVDFAVIKKYLPRTTDQLEALMP